MNFILSVNIRGLGADMKFLALKNMFWSKSPKIILIQETMHPVHVTISYFRKMLPSWYISATDDVGLSGGLAVIWDPRWIIVKAYKCLAGILISAHVRGLNFRFNILNIYAPFQNKSDYWVRLFASKVFDIGSLLIAGDLNLTLSSDEV